MTENISSQWNSDKTSYEFKSSYNRISLYKRLVLGRNISSFFFSRSFKIKNSDKKSENGKSELKFSHYGLDRVQPPAKTVSDPAGIDVKLVEFLNTNILFIFLLKQFTYIVSFGSWGRISAFGGPLQRPDQNFSFS